MHSSKWIWEQQGWPSLRWQEEIFAAQLKRLYFKTGQIDSLVRLLSSNERKQFTLRNLLQSVDKQRKHLHEQFVASLYEQLGLPITDEASQSRSSQLKAEAIIDSCLNSEKDFSLERLIEWHQTLLKTERSQLRQAKDSDGTVQVLFELLDLTEWFNGFDNTQNDALIRIAIAHLRLSCIKPFNEHNIEVSRMFSNLALNQFANLEIPLSISPKLVSESNDIYIEQLDMAKRGDVDVTLWIGYFLEVVEHSLDDCLKALQQLHNQPKYWTRVAEYGLSSKQIDALKSLFNSPEPNASINTSEYQQLTGVSKPSATRHLTEMFNKGCLLKLGAGGRSTRYKLNLNLDAPNNPS